MDMKDFALYGLNDARAYLMQALDGLSDDQLMWQPQPGANHIAFILWHMFREEDRFFQYKLQGVPQIWEEGEMAPAAGTAPRPPGRRLRLDCRPGGRLPPLSSLATSLPMARRCAPERLTICKM